MNFSLSKFSRISLALLFTMILFASCQKESITYPVEGLWIGKYGNGSTAPSSGYSMVVESNGKLTVADGDNITNSSKAPGTWSLNSNVFTATYTYSGGQTFSIQATWSSDGKMTNGTWGSGANTSGLGTWYMDRKN